MAFSPICNYPLRTLLYLPAHKEHYFAKALSGHSDALLFDLEDAVPPEQKDAARQLLHQLLQGVESCSHPRIFIRVNRIEDHYLEEDFLCALSPAVCGFMLTKADHPDAIRSADTLLSQLERKAGLESGHFALLLLIETVKGILSLDALAEASDRTVGLCFGESDFSADAGVIVSPNNPTLAFSKASLVLHAHLHQILAIDTPFLDLHNPDALLESKKQSFQMGFDGTQLIHPSHIDPANRCFSSSPEQLVWAQEVISSLSGTQSGNSGALSLHGQMIDAATIRQAEYILSRAEKE